MDDIDRNIIEVLHSEGRLSFEQLARRVRLSRPAVYERVRRLEARGVIRGYGARVDWSKAGLPITAFVLVRTRGNCLMAARAILSASVDGTRIEECHRVAGDYCLLFKVRAVSPQSVQDLLDAFRAYPAIEATHTTIVLSTIQEEGVRSEAPAGAPLAVVAAVRKPPEQEAT